MRPVGAVAFATALAFTLSVSSVLAQTNSTPLPTIASQDAAYGKIARAYFYDGFRESPTTATATGVHDYDTQLDDVTPKAIAAHIARSVATMQQLQAIDPATLSPEVALDRTMLIGTIDEDLWSYQSFETWKHNPDVYTGIASNALYLLVSRNFAPLPVRMRDAIARERRIPGLLAQAKRNITTVDASTLRLSLEDAEGTNDLFAQTLPAAFVAVKDAQLQAAFRRENSAARVAMQAYAAWIKALKPHGSFAIGAVAYRRLLHDDDAVDMPLPQLLAVAQQAFERTRSDYVATARAISPGKTPEQVYAQISRVHPAGRHLLDAAQNDLARLRSFLIDHHIVSVPPEADVRVTETPAFDRSTVVAAMDAPGPLEQVATRAFYWVTPPDPSWSKDKTEGYLEGFSDFERPILAAHEVYPGHYLNFIIDRRLPLSLTRKLASSGAYTEGWAHYDEQMVVDQGWGNGDPRVRLAQLQEAILRNCRFIVGIQLHTGGWTEARARRFFATQCFQVEANADVEALRGTNDPLFGRYTMGKLMILKLRADYKRKLGAEFTLQKFHDAFLAHGDPPIPLLRKVMLGDADDGRPL